MIECPTPGQGQVENNIMPVKGRGSCGTGSFVKMQKIFKLSTRLRILKALIGLKRKSIHAGHEINHAKHITSVRHR